MPGDGVERKVEFSTVDGAPPFAVLKTELSPTTNLTFIDRPSLSWILSRLS